MKKLYVCSIFVLFSFTGFSQELGIRLGDVVGNDAAIDGVFKAGKFSRLHADVSFGHGLGVELLWDFINKPVPVEVPNFTWYVGAGPSMLIDDPFFLGISGEIGLEYHFSTVPIALGLDWRPTFVIIEDTDFYERGFGFNARYVFGKK